MGVAGLVEFGPAAADATGRPIEHCRRTYGSHSSSHGSRRAVTAACGIPDVDFCGNQPPAAAGYNSSEVDLHGSEVDLRGCEVSSVR